MRRLSQAGLDDTGNRPGALEKKTGLVMMDVPQDVLRRGNIPHAALFGRFLGATARQRAQRCRRGIPDQAVGQRGGGGHLQQEGEQHPVRHHDIHDGPEPHGPGGEIGRQGLLVFIVQDVVTTGDHAPQALVDGHVDHPADPVDAGGVVSVQKKGGEDILLHGQIVRRRGMQDNAAIIEDLPGRLPVKRQAGLEFSRQGSKRLPGGIVSALTDGLKQSHGRLPVSGR